MSTQRFDIQHAPAPRESFRLLYISKSRFGGDWNSTTHTHSCTELFYCLSGEGQFYLAGQLFPVKPDDMVIVNPQVEHTELSLNASPLEYIVLGVAGIEILFGKADSSSAPPIQLQISSLIKISSICAVNVFISPTQRIGSQAFSSSVTPAASIM